MSDKDREAMEYYKTALYGDKSVDILFKQGFERGLEHARKEQKELLEKCNSVLGMVYHINDVDDDSVIEITANAKELILELNAAGIGKE